MHVKKIISMVIALLAMCLFIKAQVTTSSIEGIIKNTSGEALTGASIKATHVPTGTVYTTSSRNGGRFELNNMNPGGPYTVVVTFVGYGTETKTDIFLALGESQKIDVDLGTAATQLTEVVVASARSGRGSGTETTIGRDKMANMPTVGRNLQDYMRATPQFKMSSAGAGSSEGAMSFAGQNVRYNSFYIDGAVNNDVFGLAYSGTNGGQSGIAPISMDAIDQFQVSLSPYNASLGNFTGGAINAITKSGTNMIHGSAYYIVRNEDLSGKTPTGPKEAATKLSQFSNKTYGFTLGGPIIKNKLFFFGSAELQRDNTPQPFDLGTYRGDTKDPLAIQRLKDTISQRLGGYDPGDYLNNELETVSDRITTKLDWNINDNHKLALSYRYNKGDKTFIFASSPTSLTFDRNGYRFPTLTHSASAELKSTFGKSLSNRLLLTFTNVEDDRGPLGGKLVPVGRINDGANGTFFFGTEANSTANYLKQSTYNLVDQFKFNIGKNSVMVGVEAEYYEAINTFIPSTAGNYVYNSVADFYANKPFSYTVNFPLIGGADEKTTDAAAKFDIFKGAVFINDEIRVSKNLNLSLGMRADYYDFITKPRFDQFAIDSTLPKISQYYDLQGGRPGIQPKIPVALSPRVGFTLNLPDENATIRGGAGMFAGRIPMVWPSAIYNNNSISTGGFTANAQQNSAALALIKYREAPYTTAELGIAANSSKGTLVITSKEFKMPKVFRTTLAFDKRLGSGWSFTLENMFTKNINDVYYTNVNLLPPTLKMATGPDTRPIYPSSNTIPIRVGSTTANPYSAIYLLSNAKGQKGFSYNFTVSVNKTTRSGFNLNTSYNYGVSQVINEAQSSTPGSQWSSMETVNGRNYLGLSESDNSAAHRIFAYASQKIDYLDKKMSTTISLAYTGQSGSPFSYVYNGQVVRDGINQFDLLYIPTQTELAAMTFNSLTVSGTTYQPADQKAAFEQFIQNDKYLSKHRGQYADRNSNRTPFTHVIDLKITQAFNLKFGDRTYSAEVGYSMFNFTNFLNRDWGRQYVVNDDKYQLVGFSYVSSSNLSPTYTFNPNTPTAPTVYQRFNPSYTARWLSQLEFRIKF
jgi:outer membrane receptor for ferrienterochelin and colicin